MLREKVTTGSFFALRHGFRAFDPQGNGIVTKEALYRILFNFLGYLSHQKFIALLQKLSLSNKKVISFDDFFAKFRQTEPVTKWLDPVTRHGRRLMTAQQVYQVLKERAKQRILTLSDIFPSAATRGPPKTVVKPELRNMLTSLQLCMSDEEFDKLWKKFDHDGIGILQTVDILTSLGVCIEDQRTPIGRPVLSALPNSSKQRKVSSTIRSNSVKTLPAINTDINKSDKREGSGAMITTTTEEDKIINDISKVLSVKYNELLAELKGADPLLSGLVTCEVLREVLYNHGIIVTLMHLQELLERLGYPGNKMLPYRDVLRYFWDRSRHSITHQVMTDKSKSIAKDGHKSVVCTTVPEAELQIVSLLQEKFLELLGRFRYLDSRGQGYVRKKDFRSVLEDTLGGIISTQDFENLVERIGLWEDIWVPYPKFLVMFESVTSRKSAGPPGRVNSAELKADDSEINKIKKSLTEIIVSKLNLIQQLFEELDTCNTGRITEEMFKELLHRFGIQNTTASLQAVWEKILKNREGTVSYHEFIRHFGASRLTIKSAVPGQRKRTEDHFFMRSRKLHRDEDMIEDALRSKLWLYSTSLLRHFKSHDTNNSGLIHNSHFKEIIKDLCQDLSEAEINNLCSRFQDEDGNINYESFMMPIAANKPVYRDGNHLNEILAHKNIDVIEETKLPQPYTAAPTEGIPGVTAELKAQIVRNWKRIRRQFRNSDWDGSGLVPVDQFTCVLTSSGVLLDSEQLFQVLESLDKDLSGYINYKEFFNAVLA